MRIKKGGFKNKLEYGQAVLNGKKVVGEYVSAYKAYQAFFSEKAGQCNAVNDLDPFYLYEPSQALVSPRREEWKINNLNTSNTRW